jgi:hypothetical protein
MVPLYVVGTGRAAWSHGWREGTVGVGEDSQLPFICEALEVAVVLSTSPSCMPRVLLSVWRLIDQVVSKGGRNHKDTASTQSRVDTRDFEQMLPIGTRPFCFSGLSREPQVRCSASSAR